MCVAVLNRFQAVPGSDVIVGADDIEVLQVLTSDLISCLHGNLLRVFCDVVRVFCPSLPHCAVVESACADEPSCHHVALFNTQSQCELYSTHTANTKCNTSQQVHECVFHLFYR